MLKDFDAVVVGDVVRCNGDGEFLTEDDEIYEGVVVSKDDYTFSVRRGDGIEGDGIGNTWLVTRGAAKRKRFIAERIGKGKCMVCGKGNIEHNLKGMLYCDECFKKIPVCKRCEHMFEGKLKVLSGDEVLPAPELLAVGNGGLDEVEQPALRGGRTRGGPQEVVKHNGYYWCLHCFTGEFAKCAHCKKLGKTGEMIGLDGGFVCKKCKPEVLAACGCGREVLRHPINEIKEGVWECQRCAKKPVFKMRNASLREVGEIEKRLDSIEHKKSLPKYALFAVDDVAMEFLEVHAAKEVFRLPFRLQAMQKDKDIYCSGFLLKLAHLNLGKSLEHPSGIGSVEIAKSITADHQYLIKVPRGLMKDHPKWVVDVLHRMV